MLPSADHNELTHDVNDFNEITGITLLQDGGPLNSGPVSPQYDAAGNLQCDGNYYYQYDAWNRLIQVDEAQDVGGSGVYLAELLKHALYDGLDRLVCTRSPVSGGTSVRTKRCCCDRIRRLHDGIAGGLVIPPMFCGL